MSLNIYGESIDVISNHSKEDVLDTTGLEAADYCDDSVTEHQALRLGLMNVQIFPNNILHHKNGSILILINDYYINFFGMSEMNTYWPAVSTQRQS